MILRAGEVLEQIAERLGRDDTQVEAEPVLSDHGRLGRALRSDLDHPGKRAEGLEERRRIGRRRDQVEVSHRLPVAPGRARDRDAHRGRVSGDRFRDGAQRRQGRAEQRPLRALGRSRLRQCGEDLLLRLLAETGQAAELLLLGGRPQRRRRS